MPFARQKAATDGHVEAASVAVTRPNTEIALDVALRKIAAATGKGHLKIMQEFAGLAFGPGRISFRDYVRLRLFDDEFYAGTDKKTVVGQRRNRDMAAALHYRTDWLGLIANKVATGSYLAAYGFPTIPFVAIFGDNLEIGMPPMLARNRQELRAVLTTEGNYPLYGKPVEAYQSLGSVALRRYVPAGDQLERTDGTTIALEDFLTDVTTHYAKGYVLQRLASPHPTVLDLCGDRLATVRIVTIATEQGPKVFRACWKIPVGSNSADNYWRAGNLLAQLDVAQGQILRVMSGTGFELAYVSHHPDTQAALVGAHIPNWQDLISTAIAGARLMQHVPLIGWDIAPVASGVVVVEMNETPDLLLNQLADGRGALEPEFLEFVEFQKRNAAEHERRVRADISKL